MDTIIEPELLIELFMDHDSWMPLMGHAQEEDDGGGDGVVCGAGTIRGQQVCMYIQDIAYRFGTIGGLHGAKIIATIDRAIQFKCPLIGIIQTGGARIDQGPVAMHAGAAIAAKLAEASGYIPSISIINGPGAGGGAYMSSMSDFSIMNTEDSYLFLTGPKIIKKVLNEQITTRDLGGPEIHTARTGLSHHYTKHIKEALQITHKLLDVFHSRNRPGLEAGPSSDWKSVLPKQVQAGYDMREVIDQLVDPDSFFEQSCRYATNAITAFARMNERSIGIIANQPNVLGGVLDIRSTKKIARFVQICDAHEIPMLFLVDCPGYLPGKEEEWGGTIGCGAFMTHVISESTVPRVTVIIRKAIGGAYATLNSSGTGSDYNLAWPDAQIAVLGSGTVTHLLKDDMTSEQYAETYLTPYLAAERGFIDEVVEPPETRCKLIRVFDQLATKARMPRLKKKRSILPLA